MLLGSSLYLLKPSATLRFLKTLILIFAPGSEGLGKIANLAGNTQNGLILSESRGRL
jgi:hypothetical protein